MRWGMGETGGLILKNWKAKGAPSDPEFYDRLYIGQDFGFNDADAILTLGTKDGDIYILDEILRGKRTRPS